jgi:hypothetical protein
MATRREPAATIIRGQLAAPETKSTRDARLVLGSNENGDVLVTSGVEKRTQEAMAIGGARSYALNALALMTTRIA